MGIGILIGKEVSPIKTMVGLSNHSKKTGGLHITRKNPTTHKEKPTVAETIGKVLQKIGRDHAARAAEVAAGHLLTQITQQRRRPPHIKTTQAIRPIGMGRVTKPIRE